MILTAVLGAADCLDEDVRRLTMLVADAGPPAAGQPTLWLAVNDVGSWWPGRLDAWATLHPELLRGPGNDPHDGDWERARSDRGLPCLYTTYAPRGPGVHEVVQHWGGGGAAGYGARIAEHVGSTHVALCGCPLDDRPYHGASTEYHDITSYLDVYRRGWERRLDRDHQRAGRFIRDRVRSMSGWTRDLLGAPTTDWLLS